MDKNTLIIIGVVVTVVFIIGAYLFMRKKSQHKTHHKATSGTQSLSLSPPQIVSGHYYLQSVNTGLYLDSQGQLHKNMTNATDFYINVDTHQMDPEPKLSIGAAQNSQNIVNMYINGSNGLIGIVTPNGATSYVSVTSGGLSLNTNVGKIISNNYLWKLIPS